MTNAQLNSICHRLQRRYEQFHKCGPPPHENVEKVVQFLASRSEGSFQCVMYVTQNENYSPALARIGKDDVLCDMGAGDLRFALMASRRAKKVYAVEMNPRTLTLGLSVIGYDLPNNLIPVCADWREFPVPRDVTVITCLVNGAANVPLPEWRRCRFIQGHITHKGGEIREIMPCETNDSTAALGRSVNS